MYRYALILVLVAMMALVACAPKEEAPAENATEETVVVEAPMGMMNRLDTNNDGVLTLEEHKAGMPGWFQERDLEGDGGLCVDDRNALVDNLFKLWDTNGDGSVALEERLVSIGGEKYAEIDTKEVEVAENPEFTFMNMDCNGDGQVEMAEQLAFTTKRFVAMDADGDGMLTLDEMKKTILPMYEKMDVNADGVVNLDEAMKHRLQ